LIAFDKDLAAIMLLKSCLIKMHVLRSITKVLPI